MNRPIHVALYIPSLNTGGAERITVLLARGLLEKGLQVDLVLGEAKGFFVNEIPSGIRIINLGNVRVWLALPSLIRYIRRERPTVLISALDHANIATLWARRIAKVPTRIVVCVHNTLSHASRKSNRLVGRLIPFLVRHSYQKADLIVTVSRGVADDLTNAVGLPRNRMRVIHNPVVTPELQHAMLDRPDHPWFAPGQPPVILAVGRLTSQKDFPTLIRAFALVRSLRPARLAIIGEGEEQTNLETLICDLGLENDAKLLGFAPNPYSYMASSAVFVLSSMSEGLPTVLIEALACGTPVVATDCPSGPSEILENGRYGTLVPMRDSSALAKAIMQTLDTPPDVRRLRLRANDFSVERAADHYLRMLNDLS